MAAYDALGLSGEKMTQTFAKGGPAAQKAFNQVVKAIGNVKDPADQSAIAVSLFGTQAEDLEMKVITSLGSVKSQFDMTKDTMEDVKNIKYDTLGMALQGIGRQIQTGFLIPAGEKLLPVMQNFSNFLSKNMPGIKKIFSDTFSSLGGFISNAFSHISPIFSSLMTTTVPVLKQIGAIAFSVFQTIGDFWEQNGSKIMSAYSNIFNVGKSIFTGLVGVIQAIIPIIQPILSNIVGFVMDIVGQVSAFWNENGAQILSAVQNVFRGISAVISFLAPVILFIVNTIWGNVKGLIQGALNVIMGLIKIFAGIFTGDFAKMWEGVKQLFLGAIQVVWNYVNLLFVGKILGGIKALTTGSITKISGMWTSIKGFFSGGATAAWTKVTEMGSKLTSTFSTIKTKVVDIAKSIWSGVKNQFSNIVEGATSLPGKIGAGIKSMGGKAVSGAISMGNKLLSGIGKIVNGVIKGLNWAMSKVGLDTQINEWEVPQYANGTKGHPGGLAILGDGGGPELYRTPQGFTGISPGKDTLMNLPKGTQVIPAKETREVLSNIPAYKGGNVTDALRVGAKWVGDKTVDGAKAVADKTKEGANWAADKTKAGAAKVKDTAFDIYEYASDPTKLMSKLLEKYNVTVPSFSGAFGDMAKGSFKMIKEKATGYLKDKLADFGGGGNWAGGAAAPAQVRSWVTQALAMTGTPMSWLPAMLVKAQKESGYNPRAINLWDSNFKAGHPSKGLFQTIDSTFSAHKMPGMNDIYNPIHNAVAAIRYIKSRYGSVFNTPGIKSMAQGGAYKGYYEGGNVPNTQWAWVGEQGPELMKIPGGSRVYSNDQSKGMLSGLLSYSRQPDSPNNSTATDSRSLEFNFNPNIVVQGNADENVVMAALRSGHAEFKEMVKQALQEVNDDKNRLSFN